MTQKHRTTSLPHVLGVALAMLLGLACDDAGPSVEASPASPSPASPSVDSSEAPARVSLDAPIPTAVVAPAARPEAPRPDAPRLDAPSRAEPAPTGPELRADAGLSIRRFALTRRVEGREPVSPDTRFTASAERLYAFVEARNDDAEERELVVSFHGPSGRHTGLVSLTIPADAPRWRTWAYTAHASAPGAWTAEVRTPEGVLVARQRFVVE